MSEQRNSIFTINLSDTENNNSDRKIFSDLDLDNTNSKSKL